MPAETADADASRPRTELLEALEEDGALIVDPNTSLIVDRGPGAERHLFQGDERRSPAPTESEQP